MSLTLIIKRKVEDFDFTCEVIIFIFITHLFAGIMSLALIIKGKVKDYDFTCEVVMFNMFI